MLPDQDATLAARSCWLPSHFGHRQDPRPKFGPDRIWGRFAIVVRGLHTVLAGLADPAKSLGCPRRVVKNYYPGRPPRVILFVHIGLVWTPSAPVRLLQRQVA